MDIIKEILGMDSDSKEEKKPTQESIGATESSAQAETQKTTSGEPASESSLPAEREEPSSFGKVSLNETFLHIINTKGLTVSCISKPPPRKSRLKQSLVLALKVATPLSLPTQTRRTHSLRPLLLLQGAQAGLTARTTTPL